MVDYEDRYSTEKASSVQSMILYKCDAEAQSRSVRSLMVKRKCCSDLVQLHRFRLIEVLKLDIPPRSPKNCPEAREGSTRVYFSPDQ